MSYSPLAFVRSLAHVRYGGTPAEREAADLIVAEAVRAGGNAELMPFTIPASTYASHEACVTAPFTRPLTVTPYGMCGELAPCELDLLYAERGTERDLLGHDDLSTTAVLVNALTYDVYKLLCARKAAAILTINGKYYHNDGEAGIYARNLRPRFLEQGKIPVFAINAAQATDLLRDGATRIRLALAQTDGETTSHNVLATVEGTAHPEEIIVLTAHYDSLPLGPGAWDNATGAAALMGLYRHFLANPPARTMRFIWCGAEEQGLLGSKAYIEQHESEIEQIKFCFNFDMCGTVLGSDKIFVTGKKELEIFVDQFCRETGHSAEIINTVHSSDSAPFADRGVPGIGLSRGTGSTEIHTCRDDLFPLGEQALLANIDFAAAIISRAVNAALLPVDCGMPDDVKEKLNKYFGRK